MNLCRASRHLIVMVHGLEGNSNDLRLWKSGMEQLYPLSNYEFLLCSSNQNQTHESIVEQGARITGELQEHLSQKDTLPTRISFIGHRWEQIFYFKNLCNYLKQ